MTNTTTKLYVALISASIFFELGTAMANASEFAWFW